MPVSSIQTFNATTSTHFISSLSVTLSGAHTLGHVHIENSGYGFPPGYIVSVNANDTTYNAWDASPNVFDNGYYISMFNKV